MDLCVNCGIATNRCTTLGRRALDDERTLSVIRQWRAPQPVNSSDHVCQACWDLAQRPPADGEPRRIGHRNVCLRCGRSLASRVSHPLHTGSTREMRIYNVIQDWIMPRTVEEASCICHKCWVAADRAAARMNPSPSTSSRGRLKKEIKPRVPEIPTKLQDEEVEVETKQPTIILLPDYSYTYTIEAESKPQVLELTTELQDEDVDVETIQLKPTSMLLPDHMTAIKTEKNPQVQDEPTELQDEDVDVETIQLEPTIVLLPDYIEAIDTDFKPQIQEVPTELQELPTELQDEEVEVETKQIEPTIILPDYRRAIETESRCFIRGCRSKKRSRVPISTRKMLLIQYKYYVPKNNRLCDQHLAIESWDFLNSSRNNCLQTFTATQIQDMLSLKEFDEKNDHVRTWSGSNKAQFNTKLTNCYVTRKQYRPRRRYKKFMYRKLWCEPCGIKFDSREQSDHHKREMHKCQGWVCEVCGKMFASLAWRGRHAQTHLPPRFACDHCHYKTASKHMLVKHMQVHTGARPHQCEYCPKTFPTSSNAKRHVQRVHLRLKPHACPHPQCGKTFFCKYKRNTHAATHKSIKRFECEECGSGFMLRGSWRKHLLDRHGVDTEWLRPGPDHHAAPLAQPLA